MKERRFKIYVHTELKDDDLEGELTSRLEYHSDEGWEGITSVDHIEELTDIKGKKLNAEDIMKIRCHNCNDPECWGCEPTKKKLIKMIKPYR